MDSTDQMYEILDAYKNGDISSNEAIHDIKLVFVAKLAPYIGDDYDNARKIIAL